MMLLLLLFNLLLLILLFIRLSKRQKMDEERMQQVLTEFDRAADRNITLVEGKIEELKEWIKIADKKLLQLRKLATHEESNISGKL